MKKLTQAEAEQLLHDPITARNDDDDRAEHRRQLDQDKHHPAHGLDEKDDTDD